MMISSLFYGNREIKKHNVVPGVLLDLLCNDPMSSFDVVKGFYVIDDTDDSLVLAVDVPGFDESTLAVSLDGRVLHVFGEIKDDKMPRHVSITYTVPQSVEQLPAATLRNGVLSLSFKKRQRQTVKIDVTRA